jgi:hypothetical protein
LLESDKNVRFWGGRQHEKGNQKTANPHAQPRALKPIIKLFGLSFFK